MGDRFDGILASPYGGVVPSTFVPSALQSLSVNETLVTEDDSNQLILFQARLNPVAGGLMYESRLASLDQSPLHDAIKNSQMTSMLNDRARCSKYERAISKLISSKPGCRVLDIGTGTGLLAMLSAKAGASHVDAVEMFSPLASLATRIIKSNNLDSVISVYPFRSTNLTVCDSDQPPPDIDPRHILPKHSDILVTEIFDSALLGEACLPAILHARECLLKPNAKIIPAKASVYARVASSSFFARFHDLGDDFPLHRSDTSRNCCGGVIPVPVHLDALVEGSDYHYVTEEVKVFEFDFEKCDRESYQQRQTCVKLKRTKEGIAHAVVMWWVLDLLGDESITYSTKLGVENWQDHWLQMVYPLPYAKEKRSDDPILVLYATHNDVSFHFSLTPTREDDPPPACSCGYHMMPGGPYRIQDLSDKLRIDRLSSRVLAAMSKSNRILIQHSRFRNVSSAATLSGSNNSKDSKKTTGEVSKGSGEELKHRTPTAVTLPEGWGKVCCLDVSDGAICGILAARCRSVTVRVQSVEEGDEISPFIYSQVAQAVKSQQAEFFSEFDPLGAVVDREIARKQRGDISWQPFDVIMSEPYTHAMARYPLCVLANLVVQCRLARSVMSENFIVVPEKASIVAQLVQFRDGTLKASFGRVGQVCGFDHSEFNDLFETNNSCEQGRLSFPLYMYRNRAIGAKTNLQTVHFGCGDELELERRRRTRVRANVDEGCADAVVVWVEYDDEEPSRTSRYEVLWLKDNVRDGVNESRAIDVCTWWEKDTAVWNLFLEEVTVSRRASVSGGGDVA